MPAVAAIASAPQNVTRAAAAPIVAPPARAAMAPSAARNTRAVAGTARAPSARARAPRRRAAAEAPQREARSRRRRGLQRSRNRAVRDAELVASVGAERVVRHELLGHLLRELLIQAPAHVDAHELAVLAGVVGLELLALARQIGLLAVGLRADRDVLAGRHRHRAGHRARDAGRQQAAVTRVGRRDADEQARRRHDAVVGAEHGGPQPADALQSMPFSMPGSHAPLVYRSMPSAAVTSRRRRTARPPSRR